MNIVEAGYEILNKDKLNLVGQVIERNRYNSETNITVKFICDSNTAYELLHNTYAVNIKENIDNSTAELSFIEPAAFKDDDKKMIVWLEAMYEAEKSYRKLLKLGSRKEATCLLPKCLATEVEITMCAVEWRLFFLMNHSDTTVLQSTKKLIQPLLRDLIEIGPNIFGDLTRLLDFPMGLLVAGSIPELFKAVMVNNLKWKVNDEIKEYFDSVLPVGVSKEDINTMAPDLRSQSMSRNFNINTLRDKPIMYWPARLKDFDAGLPRPYPIVEMNVKDRRNK